MVSHFELSCLLLSPLCLFCPSVMVLACLPVFETRRIIATCPACPACLPCPVMCCHVMSLVELGFDLLFMGLETDTCVWSAGDTNRSIYLSIYLLYCLYPLSIQIRVDYGVLVLVIH